MLDSFPITLFVGVVLGFLAGVGVGGGSLLILWLTLVLGMDHEAARFINLLFFIPSALVASLFRWEQGKLDLHSVLPAAVAGCIGAYLFSHLGKQVDIDVIKKGFGFLLLITGIRELFYKPRHQRPRKAR